MDAEAYGIMVTQALERATQLSTSTQILLENHRINGGMDIREKNLLS